MKLKSIWSIELISILAILLALIRPNQSEATATTIYINNPAIAATKGEAPPQDNTAKITNANQSQVVDQQQLVNVQPHPTSLLNVTRRPSITQVASELSKKHLNLEHENWRLKHSSPPRQQADAADHLGQLADGASPALLTNANGLPATVVPTFDEEADITATHGSGFKTTPLEVSANPTASSPSSYPLQQQTVRDHYLNIDSASVANEPKSVNNSRQIHLAQRRRKGHFFLQSETDNELYQCHRYLQQHSSPKPSSPSSAASNNQVHNQLPCSCESRRNINVDRAPSLGHDDNNLIDSTWLSCDNVQLIGSHFYTITKSANDNRNGSANSSLPLLTRFSQRNSGLQTLHSQKFHYLLLYNLRYIDLSSNRLRQIQLDAFHGLENKLEHLNLANNFLGDSHVMFDLEQTAQNPANKNGHLINDNNNGKLIFFSDELNRLKNLKWLSLRNNQINQLSLNIFTKYPSSNDISSSSELRYLDLSDNLIQSVPSESIQFLHKLESINLSKNRIQRLDRLSKFPKSLEHLDLSENLIKIIKHCDLIDLPNLVELNLSFNQLNRLDKTAFVSATLTATATSSSLTDNLAGNIHNLGEVSQVARIINGQINLINDGGGQVQNLLSPSNERVSINVNHGRQKRESEPMEVEKEDGTEFDLEVEESISSPEFQSNKNRKTMADELGSLQQINCFNSTQRLNLSHNFLEQIPGDALLKFPNLRHLDLSYNRVRKLDSNYLCSIYNLVDNLRELDLSGNLLSMITQQQPQSQPSARATVQNDDNSRQLNRIFGCLQKLEKLKLSTNVLGLNDGNRRIFSEKDENDEQQNGDNFNKRGLDRLIIKFGDSSGGRFLNHLDLSDNKLRMMPVIRQYTNQPSISLVNNSDSGSRGATNQQDQLNRWMNSRSYLEILNLNYNYIDRLDEHDFEHLFNLKQLYLDSNKLSNLPTKLTRRFTSLDKLSLSGNRITLSEPLNELFERSIKTMRVLDLSNNRIIQWPRIDKPIMSQLDAATGSSSSKANDFDEKQQYHVNQLALVFALEELYLEGNLLTSGNVTSLFDQLIYLKSLKTLNLSFNFINRIKSEWFKYSNKNLQRLIFTGNKINSIDLGSFAPNQVDELTRLNLDYNLLKELNRKTFDSLPKLKELNLAHNLIHTINSETFHHVNSLQVLKLNNNKLTSWKCEYFSHLCNSLSGNINADLAALLNSNIQSDETLPPSVSSLIELDLSHNSLSQLRVNSISVHTKLVKLNLEHNKLSFIPQDLFKATTASSTSNRQIQLVSSLKYLNLAHNRIQTIDNVNFRPLKNLLSLDLSFNELQTVGVDVVLMDSKNIQREQNNRRIIVSNNLTNLITDDDVPHNDNYNQTESSHMRSNKFLQSAASWPALSKLRHLNMSNNQLTMVNQSLINELSPFALLNLDLSNNYLDSESLPYGFYTKISSAAFTLNSMTRQTNNKPAPPTNYDLVFTLKLESLDLSHNRLNEFPTNLLDNHHTSLESCNLAYNRIQNLIPNSNLMVHIKSINLEANPLNRESNELLLFEQKSARTLNLAGTRLYAIQQASSAADQLAGSSSTSTNYRFRIANQTSQLDLIKSISNPIDAPYLRNLNLSSNQLVWLAANVFNKMHSLQTLDLSNNQLTRLHLLNNQLSRVSSTLEYLNMASNLFTNIDSSDFNQLSKLKHLDLSNMLSLQKLNCKFLSKLTTLKVLKMFNYPLLRNNLNSMLSTIRTNENGRQRSEGLQKKFSDELMMATIGKHCFRDDLTYQLDTVTSLDENPAHELKWLDLSEMELEMFNNFDYKSDLYQKFSVRSNGFNITDELSQLIGSRTTKISLYGLNITQISDDTLFGITNDHLTLRISYTSMSQLPSRQILNSVAKKTRLELDYRYNNIQTVDTSGLQFLDELQSNNQILSHGDYSSLKLSFNPIRCDCQTRPLWLWLNRKRDNADVAIEDASAETSVTQANNTSYYWVKLMSIVQTSDLTCFYPLKLRGQLAQHVYYNDLVCKGLQQSDDSPVSRQSRKRNETKTSDSYYITVNDPNSDIEDASEDDYYLESESTAVRLTRFNHYPSTPPNNSITFSNLPIPPLTTNKFNDATNEELASNRIGKRDHNSVPAPGPLLDFNGQSILGIQYNKYRPNIQQKHSHFNTLNAFNQIPLGKNFHSKVVSSQPLATKHSLLTDSDVYILTVASIAMTVMSFVIISVCLFKYRLDRSDKGNILDTHNKLFMAHAIHLSSPAKLTLSDLQPFQNHSSSSANSSSSSKSSSKQSKKINSCMANQHTVTKTDGTNNNHHHKQSRLFTTQHSGDPHILVPINHSSFLPTTQNFLMRSPTIRRMHTLAKNPKDLFKFAMRPSPMSSVSPPGKSLNLLNGRKRRNMYVGPNGKMIKESQLMADKFAPQLVKGQKSKSHLATSSLASGCPLHAFNIIRILKEGKATSDIGLEDQCVYCRELLKVIQRTKIQHLMGKAQAKSSNSSSSDQSSSQKTSKSLPELLVEEDDGCKLNNNLHSDSNIQSNRDEDPSSYITPGLIKALAKQLDQQQERITGRAERKSECRVKSTTHRSRDQQIRSMRTFGVGKHSQISSTATSDIMFAKTQDQPSQSNLQYDNRLSQLPTIDVNGRFAYQTDSQVESPAFGDSCNRNSLLVQSESRNQNTPSTSIDCSNQENVFILVHDDINTEVADGQQLIECSQDQFEIVRVEDCRGNKELACLSDGVNSIMNDECSHSSSPIAYGFMRSSPSVTTLSSQNVNPQQHGKNHASEKDKVATTLAMETNNNDDFIRNEDPIIVSRL